MQLITQYQTENKYELYNDTSNIPYKVMTII